ncbi:hypothetical protein TRIP_E100126 [uncultured Spirochaetota bacterium]|nr:hypothetical protein TRIP_E100126 [uncultured Spirochaetota bacterium]
MQAFLSWKVNFKGREGGFSTPLTKSVAFDIVQPWIMPNHQCWMPI